MWDQELLAPRKTNEKREKTGNVGQSNKPISIPKKERQANKEEMEKFTVENFHSAICRHIRGTKGAIQLWNGRGRECRREWAVKVNWKILNSGWHKIRVPVASCPASKINICKSLV